MAASQNKLLGVVLIIRHGDRQGFYQDPITYGATATAITPLGTKQEFQLGQQLRSLYFDATSPSFISGINSSFIDLDQVKVRADAGGEAGVILSSAMALVQGLFPANSNNTIVLANGTIAQSPLGGYQYVPIESVEPGNDVSLEGYTNCAPFDQNTALFYNSTIFKQKADEAASFLQQLHPYVDGRPVSLQNMWNIFDFMNVQSIHNATFLNALPSSFLAQARDLANWHEYAVFSSSDLGGIGNIAGRTILPSILDSLHKIANSSDPLKLAYEAVAYKPFISLFNMTGAAQMNPQLAGVVNYAAALALELRQSPEGNPIVRFNFKNGSDDAEFKTYPFFNESGDVPLSLLANVLSPSTINSTAEWCQVCSNTQDRGCAAINTAIIPIHKDKITPVGAGFLGAGILLVVVLSVLGILIFTSRLTFVKYRPKRTHPGASHLSSEKLKLDG